MKQKELREKMPEVAATVDWLCEIFGQDAVHGQIRKALNGEPVFFACENGHKIGTPIDRGEAVTWHPITQCAIDTEIPSIDCDEL